MPAKSKSQKRLMSMAKGFKKGSIKEEDLNPKYAETIKNLAKTMSIKSLNDFIKADSKKLPETVSENVVLHFRDFK